MKLREASPADISFVFDTYLNDWRKSPYAGTLRNNRYFEAQRCTLEDLIARGALVVVACDDRPELEEVIQGWACYEVKNGECVLHYLYQRPGYTTHEFILTQIAGTKPGLLTHRLPIRELKAWKILPEIARRKYL